jgi:hypothetical protein
MEEACMQKYSLGEDKDRHVFTFDVLRTLPRLPSIAIAYPSSLAKGTSEILCFYIEDTKK